MLFRLSKLIYGVSVCTSEHQFVLRSISLYYGVSLWFNLYYDVPVVLRSILFLITTAYHFCATAFQYVLRSMSLYYEASVTRIRLHFSVSSRTLGYAHKGHCFVFGAFGGFAVFSKCSACIPFLLVRLYGVINCQFGKNGKTHKHKGLDDLSFYQSFIYCIAWQTFLSLFWRTSKRPNNPLYANLNLQKLLYVNSKTARTFLHAISTTVRKSLC